MVPQARGLDHDREEFPIACPRVDPPVSAARVGNSLRDRSPDQPRILDRTPQHFLDRLLHHQLIPRIALHHRVRRRFHVLDLLGVNHKRRSRRGAKANAKEDDQADIKCWSRASAGSKGSDFATLTWRRAAAGRKVTVGRPSNFVACDSRSVQTSIRHRLAAVPGNEVRRSASVTLRPAARRPCYRCEVRPL